MVERRNRIDRRNIAQHPLVDELRSAIDGELIEVLFQPQFSAHNGALTGGEALVRWDHDTRGMLAGDTLFAIAAKAGMSEELSRHIYAKALGFAAKWPRNLRLSINVTAADLATRHFSAAMSDAIDAAGLSPEQLTLEITEQALVFELEASARKLEQLVERGVRIALDDFGAGFCNFRYLKVLPLHYLKLDRSMLEGITEDQRDLEVFRGIIAMAKALDLTVIAEGVETEAQREAIAQEGCALWQGFLGARPMSAASFASFSVS